MRSTARRGLEPPFGDVRGSSPPRSSMRDEAYFTIGASTTSRMMAPGSSYPAAARAHLGLASHGPGESSMRAEEWDSGRFRSAYSASQPSHDPHSAYRWSNADRETHFGQRERYRLPSPAGPDRYNAGHEFWPRDGYAAAGLPSRPVLEQLQHQHEQGQARLQQERFVEQQLQLEQRQQRLYEKQLRLQEEQAMLQRHLQAQARSRVVVPEPVSPEDIAAASLLAMTGEESDATGENDNDLDDDHPSKKKKSLCKVKGCGKLDKGRGFCKLHGGGKRCKFESCDRAARGSSGFCITHGGGPRCQVAHCPKSARTVGGFCKAHGGGRKCKARNCRRTARGEGDLCSDHADQSSLHAHFMGAYPAAAGSTMYPHAHHHMPLPPYAHEPSPFGGSSAFGYMGSSMMPSSMPAGAYTDSSAAVDRYPPMRGSTPFSLLASMGPHAHAAGFAGHATAPSMGMHGASRR